MRFAANRAWLLSCALAWTIAPPAAWADFPFPLRRDRPELENPFQRPPDQATQVTNAAGAVPPGADQGVRLASALQGAWIDPPPMEGAVETADVYVQPHGEYVPDLMFPSASAPWCWELLPDGLIYRSYLAGPREPRIGLTTFHENGSGDWLWDSTLGGRRSLLRYGNGNPQRPEGFEVQIEGAALVRLNLEQNRDVESSDFRVGVPLVYGVDNWQFKTGYYHLSSHLGDEYLNRNLGSTRINYVRDAIFVGLSYYPDPALRLYGETAYAFYTSGGADPWEFQVGFEYAEPGPTGCAGTPFVAANGHLRQEIDFGGDLTLQAGWLWRGATGSMLRAGFHYLNGKSNQYQFFDISEEQIGFGVWYDF